MSVQAMFEQELKCRGIPFGIDAESGRHFLEIREVRMLISLDNLERDVAADGDTGRISRFVEAIIASSEVSETALSAEQLFWCLEPNDHKERADYRVAVSDRVDRVLVRLSDDGRLVTWITPSMLKSLGMSESDAGARALVNLGGALNQASIETKDIDDVQLGMMGTALPFKASLILAPNLREVVEPVLGWPLMAVVPDRNFLFLWAARHTDFVRRVGRVVVDEYSKASYRISTEVYEITDKGICAIGEFPTEA